MFSHLPFVPFHTFVPSPHFQFSIILRFLPVDKNFLLYQCVPISRLALR
jgi:hypothetical protein